MPPMCLIYLIIFLIRTYTLMERTVLVIGGGLRSTKIPAPSGRIWLHFLLRYYMHLPRTLKVTYVLSHALLHPVYYDVAKCRVPGGFGMSNHSLSTLKSIFMKFVFSRGELHTATFNVTSNNMRRCTPLTLMTKRAPTLLHTRPALNAYTSRKAHSTGRSLSERWNEFLTPVVKSALNGGLRNLMR